jgi:hypothetical protein
MEQFLPNAQDRLNIEINVALNFAAMATGQGKTRAYLKLMEHATCPCSNGRNTIDHLLY